MSRWISSALCTLAIVAVLFCLPFWGIRSSSSTAASIVSDTTVSNVSIVRRAAKRVPPAAVHTNVPSIPKAPAETIPLPEEEAPPEQREAPEETSDETAETSDKMQPSDAGGNLASDAPNTGGAVDSFSHTHDAKAVATYKSYVLGRIASKKTYPYAARSSGLEGKVRARIAINPDGTLAEAVILNPSEYELLNNACLAAIKKSAPFRKMTGGAGAMTLSFVMDFSLH